ncbi:MAG: phage major capsid protein [Planctomycetaceae bacterium]|jgi:HK97 family phage major capsid protein|nr:phage major capsid protein [Planctomycetaceae bacterium]
MEKNKLDRNSEEYRGLFSRYLARGHNGLTDVEARALSEGSATGGAVLFPTTYSNMFMAEMGDDRIVGQVSKVYTSTGTFSVPIITPANSSSSAPRGFSVQNNPGEAGTLIDATAGSQAQVTVPSFTQPGTSNNGTGTSTFTLKRISVMVRASRELVEDSASQGDASVENIIVKQASQDILRELSRQILLGNKDDSVTAGTASTAGSDACHGIINTLKRYSRSLTTTTLMGSSAGNLGTANAVLAATLGICMDDRLAPHYWERATWIFNATMHRNTGSSVGTGFGTSSTGSASNMLSVGDRIIWGRPWMHYDMSPAQFNTTNGAQAGEQLVVAADLSRYLLAFAGNGISVTRLNETYAATNEVAFIVSVRCAGALTDVNAAFGIHRG